MCSRLTMLKSHSIHCSYYSNKKQFHVNSHEFLIITYPHITSHHSALFLHYHSIMNKTQIFFQSLIKEMEMTFRKCCVARQSIKDWPIQRKIVLNQIECMGNLLLEYILFHESSYTICRNIPTESRNYFFFRYECFVYIYLCYI